MPWSPLHSASRQEEIDSMMVLLSRCDNVHRPDALGMMHQAARHGHVAAVDVLANNGAQIHTTDATGKTPLHVACAAGHTSVVKALIQHRAALNARNNRAQTPLHVASFAGHLKVIQMLMNHGADTNLKDRLERTPLDLVTGVEDSSAVDVLQGAKRHSSGNSFTNQSPRNMEHTVNAKSKPSILPLHQAARSGDVALVGALIAGGAGVDMRDSLGQTPMHKVAGWPGGGRLATDVVSLLAAGGADMKASDAAGDTLLHAAAAHNNIGLVHTLTTQGADLNANNCRQQTALHKAAESGHANVLQMLARSRADLTARDALGRSALDRSMWIGHDSAAAVLRHSARTAGLRASQHQHTTPPAFAGELRHMSTDQELGLGDHSSKTDWRDTLVHLLMDGEPHTHSAVDDTLASMMQASSLPDLLGSLRDNRDIIRIHSIRAVGKQVADGRSGIAGQVSSVIQTALRVDQSWRVREEAAKTLGIIGAVDPSDQGSVLRQVLAACLHRDANEAVEKACQCALEHIFKSTSVPELLKALRDSDVLNRKLAIHALGVKVAENPRQLKWLVLDPLSDVLYKDPSWDVRQKVPAALQILGISDPLDAGLGAVTVIRKFLDGEYANLILSQWRPDPKQAELTRQVVRSCNDALMNLDRHIIFYGWRKIAHGAAPSDFPIPVTSDYV